MSTIVKAVGFAAIGSVVMFMGLCTYLTVGNMAYRVRVKEESSEDAAEFLYDRAIKGWATM